MKKIVLIILLFFAAGLTAVFAAQTRETLTLAAADLKNLSINCGAGYLNVQGVDGLDQIEVSAVLEVRGISADDLAAFKKEYVTLKLEKVAGRAELTASIDSDFSLARLFEGGNDARIDLDVRLPRRLDLTIDDGSGDMTIHDCGGNVGVVDGSGDVRLTNINGQVKVDDGSGSIFLSKINGRLRIDDGSGDIELNEAGADVRVDDGSGEINLSRVLGSVTIDDGSGDIVIDGVEKDVIIEEAGSGGVEIRNVKGKVSK